MPLQLRPRFLVGINLIKSQNLKPKISPPKNLILDTTKFSTLLAVLIHVVIFDDNLCAYFLTKKPDPTFQKI